MRWVSSLRLLSCSLTMKRWSLLQTTIGVSMPSNTRRSRVCWNSVCSPVRARNCLGNCLRESGQRREPLPPDKITGIMLLLLENRMGQSYCVLSFHSCSYSVSRLALRFNVGASLLAKAAYQSTSMLNVRPLSRAGSIPQGNSVSQAKCLARRNRAFYPDWRQAAAFTGDVQHGGFTAFQGNRLHVADFGRAVVQGQADFDRVDFTFATALGRYGWNHFGLAVSGFQGQGLVAEVLHANQGFLLVLERRLFDQLRRAAGVVDQCVIVITGQFHRQGLAADLGAVVAARHEAEVGAGQRRDFGQVGAADGGADFSVTGVVDTDEARTFRSSRAVECSVTSKGGHRQHAHASNKCEGLGETARSSSESHGSTSLFQFCARSGVSDLVFAATFCWRA